MAFCHAKGSAGYHCSQMASGDSPVWDDFVALVETGEDRRLEFKPGGNQADDDLLARVARAVMAMANTVNGGEIVIGVDEADSNVPVFTGMSAEEATSWLGDDAKDRIASYCEPRTEFTVSRVDGHQGDEARSFIRIRVSEFDTVPIICRKPFTRRNGQVLLRRGACYVRPIGKPESREVMHESELREVLDIATSKAVLKAFTIAELAADGLARNIADRLAASSSAEPRPTSEDLYRQQREAFDDLA